MFYISLVGLVGLVVVTNSIAKKTDKPNENEIIINVPVAIGMMSASFLMAASSLERASFR